MDVTQVKATAKIEEVIGEYLPLTSNKDRFWAKCPFHEEKDASFTVRPKQQYFYCFSCKRGGDMFTFLEEYLHIGFQEAVALVARQYHIPMSTTPAAAAVENEERRILQAVWDFFKSSLQKNPQAQTYLAARGVLPETIQQHGIGYAPEGWGVLLNALSRFQEDGLLKVGVIGKSKGRAYDFFRHRIMFPILDQGGHIIAFGGRALSSDPKTPKYLNSPESSLFKKGHTLFGFDQAKEAIKQSRRVILCEGYFDQILSYQSGVENTVSSLGTAFTQHHLQMLGGYASELTCLFDPDAAGHHAISRHFFKERTVTLTDVATTLLQQWEVNVAVCPDGYDPAELVTQGIGLSTVLAAQIPLLQYIYTRLLAGKSLQTTAEKVTVIRMIGKILSTLPIAYRADQIPVIADMMSLSDTVLSAQLKKELTSPQSSRTPEIIPSSWYIPPVEIKILRSLFGLTPEKRRGYTGLLPYVSTSLRPVISHLIESPDVPFTQLSLPEHLLPNVVECSEHAYATEEIAEIILEHCMYYYERDVITQKIAALSSQILATPNFDEKSVLEEKQAQLRSRLHALLLF